MANYETLQGPRPSLFQEILNKISQPIPDNVQQKLINSPIPNIDLGSIPMPSQTIAPNISNVVPQEVLNPTTTTDTTQNKEKKPMSPFMQALIRALPTLLATGVGLASKRALPGAAGFVGGYEGELSKQRELEGERKKEQERSEEVNKPSPQSLLKMAQTEAYRQMGGGLMGQAKMATDPEFKARYQKKVEELYSEYLLTFRGEGAEPSVETIDTKEEVDFGDINW